MSAAHQLDQLRADRQAQPGAAVGARGRAVGLGEGLEDDALLFRRDADAGVADGEMQQDVVVAVWLPRVTRSSTSPRSVNLMALPTRLTSTCRSRPASPIEAVGHVGRDVAEPARAPFAARAAPSVARCLSRRARRSKSIGVELKLARLDLGKVEDVVDERQQRIGRLLDQCRDSSRCSAVRSVSSARLGHADDAVHGRADFVAHVGQELALGPIGGLRFLLGLLQIPSRLACAA